MMHSVNFEMALRIMAKETSELEVIRTVMKTFGVRYEERTTEVLEQQVLEIGQTDLFFTKEGKFIDTDAFGPATASEEGKS